MKHTQTISGAARTAATSTPSRRDDGETCRGAEAGASASNARPAVADSSSLGSDAAPPVRKSARRGVNVRDNRPKIPQGDIWLDCDVAEYLKVSTRLVKKIANEGPRPGEIDLRLARPVVIGGMRRWFAEKVKALVRDNGKEVAA